METVARSGLLTLTVAADRPEQLRCAADDIERHGDLWVIRHRNSYVNTGLQNALDREFGIGAAPAVGFIGVSSDNSAATLGTVFLNGSTGGTTANTIIKALSSAATRVAQTVTTKATFTDADFTAGVFVWRKMGLLTTSTDAGTGLVDAIGGGTSPFSVDFTAAGAFTAVVRIDVTAAAV